MRSWGKFRTTDRNTHTHTHTHTHTQTQIIFLKSPDKSQGFGSKSRLLPWPRALNTAKGVGKPCKPLSLPDLWTCPHTHLILGTSLPLLRERTRETVTCFSSLLTQSWPAKQTWVRSLGREDPLEKEMATHSSILAWRILWTEEPGGLWSKGSQRVGHNLAGTVYI